MKTKLLNFLAISLGLSGLLFAMPVAAMPNISPSFAATTPAPAPPTLKSSACDGLNSVDSTQGCGSASNTAITNIIAAILRILSFIVGVAAVVMVLVSGFKYVTSGGDASKIASAKTTLVYAIVGLVVVALAQAIVFFVVNSATGACTSNPAISASDRRCK